jgi:serine/threonine protein phosphatase 1
VIHGRLFSDTFPAAVYAVGDVHGCYRQLVTIEDEIAADAEAIAGDKLIVMLGDYIDRGPESAAVIEHLAGPPPEGFRRICLRGNHEHMFLDFLGDPLEHLYWLEEGGMETLDSYGIDLGRFDDDDIVDHLIGRIDATIPRSQLDFIAALPLMLVLPGFIFVHAGIRPGVAIDRQSDEDLIWIREPFLSGPAQPGYRVVHGHTPGAEPVVTPARYGLDTQCFLSGRLTALRITPDGKTRFLTAE